ncbi:hypothetical protein EHO60_13255 [Leptospira fletcheri]|uniref:Type I restriction modification DNA specificity domain-containing protein n=1 Tax=Leptospira fletcheri TaxID=2484981 RepID=A0A4R9GB54_9LEPT|nr:restriction endonuclease subunit S [Leptospira fletcheri]TGK08988.1 hypothetical protein EHO60_13255 [Leptospira fletcheri]
MPFLQGSHIVHFQPADIKYVSKSAHKNVESWIIKKGWILVTRSGTFGRIALCEDDWDGWAASEHILRIIPDETKCTSGYLYAFLNSPIGQAQLTSKIYGAVVDELTEEQTKSILVPMPRTKKQKEQADLINVEAHKAMKKKLEAIKLTEQSLDKMNQMLKIRD